MVTTARETKVKAGYKQTEVGVIPEEWAAKELGEVAALQRGYDLPHRTRKFGTVPIISSSGNIAMHNESRVTGPGVVTGRYGTIGEVFFVSEDFWPLNTTLFVKDFKGNDPLFVSFLLRTIDYQSYSGKSGVPGVNRNDLHAINVCLPPLPEQQAIATALSDVDALLASLDKLIAKKRDIKQATMQQLLTGRMRLPSFSEETKSVYKQTEIGLVPNEWNLYTFAQIATIRKTKVNPKRIGEHPFCIELEHIGQGSGQLIGHSTMTKESSAKALFNAGDVLFSRLRAYLKKYWLADRDGVCSTEIWPLVPNKDIVTEQYLFQLVQTDEFIDAASTAYGTHMPRADWNVIKNYEISLPLLDEQQTIATVLSEMDAEIVALEQKREKTRALKQGMMQELLTGRTRLL